jgi:aspartate racemase
MEDGFYHRGLEQFGLRVEMPIEEDRARIQHIQSQLARGIMTDQFRSFFATLIQKHSGMVDAVVLACTELPLAIQQKDSVIPILNPTELQCKEAFEFATGARGR